MGFWSGLAKVGKVALPLAASFIPGVGPAAAGAMKLGSKIGSAALGAGGAVLGGMADAAAANRQTKTDNLLIRDQLGMQGARDFETQQVNRAEMEMKQLEAKRALEADAYRKALKSALAMNMQDASFSRPEGVPMIAFSGGARPSAIGEQGRNAAAIMNNKATQQLMSETQGVDTKMAPAEKYKMAEMPEQSVWEKVAGPASLGLAAASHIMEGRQAAAGAEKAATDRAAKIEQMVNTPLTQVPMDLPNMGIARRAAAINPALLQMPELPPMATQPIRYAGR